MAHTQQLARLSQVSFNPMSSLTGFILFVVLLTISVTTYTYKKLQEPLGIQHSTVIQDNIKRNKFNFWMNVEITNGRLAMIGFLALVINYKINGEIIPGLY